MVAAYIKESGERLEAYVRGILDLCWDVFRREVASNEVKAACLLPIKAILRQGYESLTASVVNVPAKLDWLLEELYVVANAWHGGICIAELRELPTHSHS